MLTPISEALEAKRTPKKRKTLKSKPTGRVGTMRIEQYITAIAGKGLPPEYPVTRVEQFLAAIYAKDTPPITPITRVERYLWYKATKTGTVDDPVTNDEYFWAAWSGFEVALPEAVTNLQITLRDNAISTIEKEQTAYSIPVYDGARQMEVESIGGRTIMLNQQIVNGDFSDGTEGWAVNPSSASISAVDGVLDWSVNVGGSSSTTRHVTQELTTPCVIGHKYLIAYDRKGVEGNPEQTLRCALTVGTGSAAASDSGVLDTFQFDSSTEWVHKEFVFAATEEYKYFNIGTRSAVQSETHMRLKNVRIHDITEMFGAEVEDTIKTPEDAYALGCPSEYVDYNAGMVVSAAVSSIAIDGTDVITIPQSVTALDGYGESDIGGDANVLDFSAHTFTEVGHWVDGVWTELSEPVVSEVTLPENLVDCADGSTVTLVNENELPMPSKVKWYVYA